MSGGERKISVSGPKPLLQDFFKVNEYHVTHTRISGPGEVANARRLVFERGDSAAALLHDLDRDVVILTEQFRMPAHLKGEPWMVEVVAGSASAGETPEQTIRREILEEVGYRVDRLETIATFFVSPGGTSERIFLYYAPVRTADLIDPNAAGVASEGEDVRRFELPAKDFIAQCLAGALSDAKTLIAGLWLANRA